MEIVKATQPLFDETTGKYFYPQTVASQVYMEDGSNVEEVVGGGLFTYKHSGNTLTGRGENGKFKAAAGGTYTSFKVNGIDCRVKCGEDTEIDLVAGVWYTFILDGNNINFKQGGAGLNFKIVGGTTQPASPKENTIWVNTDIAIGYWQFASTQPETRTDGMALQTGDLWIKTRLASNVEFNALKKNGINIKVTGAMQWDGSSWITKTVKAYINNIWLDTIILLSGSNGLLGDTYTYTTEQTAPREHTLVAYGDYYDVKVTKDYGGWGRGHFNFTNPIERNGKTTLRVTLNLTTAAASTSIVVRLGSSVGASDLGSTTIDSASNTTIGTTVHNIDISSIDKFYVTLWNELNGSNYYTIKMELVE